MGPFGQPSRLFLWWPAASVLSLGAFPFHFQGHAFRHTSFKSLLLAEWHSSTQPNQQQYFLYLLVMIENLISSMFYWLLIICQSSVRAPQLLCYLEIILDRMPREYFLHCNTGISFWMIHVPCHLGIDTTKYLDLHPAKWANTYHRPAISVHGCRRDISMYHAFII